jgi:hypothetical protein
MAKAASRPNLVAEELLPQIGRLTRAQISSLILPVLHSPPSANLRGNT